MGLKNQEPLNSGEPSDQALISACVEDGDATAFESLMSRYHERVFAVIVRLVREQETARDLTQETFLKAWRALPRFEGGSSFYTWIYRIARNLVHSDFRRRQARPQISRSLDQGLDEDQGGLEFETEQEGPGDQMLRHERRRLVRNAIADLHPEFQEIIVLRDLEGHAYEEIAEFLELPLGTVRSRLHRARMELKAKLGKLLS